MSPLGDGDGARATTVTATGVADYKRFALALCCRILAVMNSFAETAYTRGRRSSRERQREKISQERDK